LEKHHDQIRQRFIEQQLLGPDGPTHLPHYQDVPAQILEWRFTVILRHLLNAVRTGEKGLFTAYCRDLAEKRFEDNFGPIEVCRALVRLDKTCLQVLREDPETEGLEGALHDHLTMTVQFGCDQVLETYEELTGAPIDEEV
jgi:hypothetical protein